MYLTFNEAHWVLVNCYRKTCNGVKHHTKGTKPSKQEIENDAKIYWLGVVANGLFPLL